MALVSPLLGDLLSLCVPKEKVSKKKGHPASLSSANRRRSPARGAAQAVAAELAYRLKQSSLFSASASPCSAVLRGGLVCAKESVLHKLYILRQVN